MSERITGAEAICRALLAEGVDTIFGYPGGQIMPFYDKLYDFTDSLRHILTRHEQGAVHAAQGYARASGRVGVVTVTSGPAATNVITGLGDANIDCTPIVVITGQVGVARSAPMPFRKRRHRHHSAYNQMGLPDPTPGRNSLGDGPRFLHRHHRPPWSRGA